MTTSPEAPAEPSAEASPPLQWSLVVATLNRPRMLRACLSLALVQDRPPAEIIVVDASEDWEATRQALLNLVEGHGITYRHVAARERSLTVQRNQGIALATSEIVFLIDDDSLMHPGCAAAVMAVYEADDEEILIGVQTALTGDVPATVQIGGMRKVTGAAELTDSHRGSQLARRLHLYLWREWFLMDGSRLFIPYDDDATTAPPIPSALSRLGVQRVPLFHGCRMTFRRSLFELEQFDPVLRSYCPGEDLDLSYRAARHGLLVTAPHARIHHFQAAEARIDRRAATMLSVLNQAVLLRRHCADVGSRWRQFDALRRRRLVTEGVKDLLSRRWDVPQFRGVLEARRGVRAIRAMTDPQILAEYPPMQEHVLAPRRRRRS